MICPILIDPATPRPRRGESLRSGFPWPRGVLRDPADLALRDAAGALVALQARVLDRWSDGSARWVLVDWLATVDGAAEYRLAAERSAAPVAAPGRLEVAEPAPGRVTVDTGRLRCVFAPGGRFPFDACDGPDGAPILDPRRGRLTVVDGEGRSHEPRIDTVAVEEAGPVRVRVRLAGAVALPGAPGCEDLLALEAWIDLFAGSPIVRIAVTLRNPRAAEHPGGFWDLGDPGSVLVKDATLRIAPAAGLVDAARCSVEAGAPLEALPLPLEVYQDSSGGEAWRSRAHVNRRGEVPVSFRGYRLTAGAGAAATERSGLRASPIVEVTAGGRPLAVFVPRFWQAFPKSIAATADGIAVGLFPGRFADLHEIQGGEQKTHEVVLALGGDEIAGAGEPLAWCRDPLLARPSPDWTCASGAIPWLTPCAADPHERYLDLVQAAIEGEESFERKRERADEYGWRHFGDLPADHEAAYYTGPLPIVSHYNNQYDAIAGFAWQFLRSGDARWHALMDSLAAHVADIDIYHTDADRPAYNHGLFWHTAHYADAATSTHRTYSRAAGPGAASGGPACEQNYATGLLHHHFLTGDPRSRAAVLELAGWVVAMDDGRRSRFRHLAGGSTGLASATYSEDHHGPGRGPGHSILALLDGQRLEPERGFLAKAEELIRRCVHPRDDIAARGLLDIERRWSYTAFLHALGAYLHVKRERGEADAMYAYARESLLAYARWMADHERPYLDRPEVLEYPTETWAAHDLRKSEVFDLAAMHSVAGPERDRFLERAAFFHDYATKALAAMPTRTFTRPLVLLLRNGLLRAFVLLQGSAPDADISKWCVSQDFGSPPRPFTTQKARARRNAIAGAVALFAIAVGAAALAWFRL